MTKRDTPSLLRDLRKRVGYSRDKLAAELGFSHGSALQRYESDEYAGRYLDISMVRKLESLLVGRGEPRITKQEVLALAGLTPHDRLINPAGQHESGGGPITVSIAELDVRAGGGLAVLEEHDEDRETVRWEVPRDLIRGQTTAPAQMLKVITVLGDSMAPDFPPGARVLVDIGDTNPTPPGVFVLHDGFGVVLKQVEMKPYSSPPVVIVKSRNPAYATYEMPLEGVVINGRVIGRWTWT